MADWAWALDSVCAACTHTHTHHCNQDTSEVLKYDFCHGERALALWRGVQKGNDPAILYAWEHVPISLYPPSNSFHATTLQTVLHKDGDDRHFRLSPSPSCWALSGREAETSLTKASLALSLLSSVLLPLSSLSPNYSAFSCSAHFCRGLYPFLQHI